MYMERWRDRYIDRQDRQILSITFYNWKKSFSLVSFEIVL